MAEDDEMAISFYEKNNVTDLTDKLVSIINSPRMQQEMALHNYEAGVRMSMDSVVSDYLRWFDLQLYKKQLASASAAGNGHGRVPRISHTGISHASRGRLIQFSDAQNAARQSYAGSRLELNSVPQYGPRRAGPTHRSHDTSQESVSRYDDDSFLDMGR